MQNRKTLEQMVEDNTVYNSQLPIFGSMIKDVRKQRIYPELISPNMLGLFALTCKKAEAETAYQRLLHCAINAEPESYSQEDETKLAAIAILKRHPELLFVKGMVTDHFGRKIFGSPYQLFLGAGDVWALKQVHEEIIPKIDDGVMKARKQYAQQFPNSNYLLADFTQQDFTDLQCIVVGSKDIETKIQSISCKGDVYKKTLFDVNELAVLHQLLLDNDRHDLCEKLYAENMFHDERNIAQIEQVKETLKKVVGWISVDSCRNGLSKDRVTKAVIDKLRQLFVPKEGELIRAGLHFPIAILREILRVYDSTWSGAQLSFLSREVIGAALAASTVVDGQSYKHGLSKLDVEKGPDRRDGLFCRYPKGIPARLAPLNDKLGRTMFVDPHIGESCFLTDTAGDFDWYCKNGVTFCSWDGESSSPARLFREFMSDKKSMLAKLIRQQPQPENKQSRCVIC